MIRATKTFYHLRKETALQNCLNEGYTPLFMPELAEARLNGTASWNDFSHTLSLRITGRTKQGSAVVLYTHVPTSLVTPAGIREAKKNLVNHAAHFPQEEFQDLVDRTDNDRIWLVDHDKFKYASSRIISVDDALAHPQTIPFLGGEDRVKHYLQGHQKAYHTSEIGVWHTDDLHKDGPLARLLFLSVDFNDGLSGDGNFDYDGLFFGVRNTVGAQIWINKKHTKR